MTAPRTRLNQATTFKHPHPVHHRLHAQLKGVTKLAYRRQAVARLKHPCPDLPFQAIGKFQVNG
jgi:hypothetical protein